MKKRKTLGGQQRLGDVEGIAGEREQRVEDGNVS